MTNPAASYAARLAVFTMLAIATVGGARAQYRGGPGAGVQLSTAGSPVAIWLAHTESSNVLRSEGGERGSYDSLGALFNLSRQRQRFSGGLDGNIEYRTYDQEVADDEPVGSVGAFADVTVVPRRLTWSFDDRYLQGRTDPSTPESPTNREHINVFTSGPELDVPFGDRTTLNAAGTYSSRRYSESEYLNSDALTYSLGLDRQVRVTTTVSIVAETTETEYEITATDYEIDGLRLSYERELAKGGAIVWLGRNRLKVGPGESTQPMARFTWIRSLTARSGLIVSATRQYTDTGRLLAQSMDDVTAEPTDVSLSQAPNDRRDVSASWSLTLDQTQISVQAAVFEDDFPGDDAFDSEGGRFGVEMEHRLGAVSTVGVGMHRARVQFSGSVDENIDVVLRLRYSRELGRMLDFEGDAQFTERDGAGSFTEQTYRLTLVYVPGRRR